MSKEVLEFGIDWNNIDYTFVKLQPNLELNWTWTGQSWSWLCFPMSQEQEEEEQEPPPNFNLQKGPTGV